MATVHHFPVQRTQPDPSAEDDLAQALRRAVDARVGAAASFGDREAAALALANEATRRFLRGDLEAIAARHALQVEVEGRIYQRHEPGTVRYYTLCGALDLERWAYREIGVRNGPTLVPLDLEAGIVEQATPALGFRVAMGYAKGHMRSCEEDMQAALANNAYLMRYARLRAVGLPVGSGVTEGACKSAIQMRTNGSSQRWRPDGLEAVLTLRSDFRDSG